MTIIDQIDAEQLADGDAPLDQKDMQALLSGTADERIRRPATAWLESYRLARWLGFRESTALHQANSAWDTAVDELALASAVCVPEVN